MKKQGLRQRALEAGAKITPQRDLVIDILEQSSDHPHAEQILERVRLTDPKVSLATVYRALKAFADLDLLRVHDFGTSMSRYEIKYDDHHDHLICTESGDVIEFQDEALDQLANEIANRLGYSLETHALELYGKPSKQD